MTEWPFCVKLDEDQGIFTALKILEMLGPSFDQRPNSNSRWYYDLENNKVWLKSEEDAAWLILTYDLKKL